ncbi:MAG: site-specific integrase [Oscillospiraceae bacterium]|nr:site-specific integrase [Oscillospiraceae bacterium]
MPAYKDDQRGTWYAMFYATDWQGVKRKHKKRGFKTQREAKEYEREYLSKSSKLPDIRFSEMTSLFMEDRKNRVRSSTLKTRQNMLEQHILPYFGNRIVSEIDNSDIRAWQNMMLGKKCPRGKSYAPTYLRTINSALSTIFNFAVEFYNLPYNPCHKVKSIGKKKADEMKFWTLDQFNQVIAAEKKPVYHLAFMLLYWTGMRSGECLALTPRKIIHESKSLRIDNTFKTEDGEDIFDDPKSENSVRVVSIPDFLYDELIEYIGRVYEMDDDERILYFKKGAMNSELDRIAEAAGVERIRLHDLRHSHVALCIKLGYRSHAIAARIGDTVTEVDKTYAHLYPDTSRDLADELNRHKDGFSFLEPK